MLDPKVFKAYDVRGLHGSELDEDGAYAVGRAYVEQFEPRTIAVGRDMRISAPAMSEAVIRGAADGGADVLDIGLVGTEMLYHAVDSLGLEGGVCVTASHNPTEYTGFKIVRPARSPSARTPASSRDRALRGVGPVERCGVVRPPTLGELRREPARVRHDRAIRPLRVVVDAANGMAGDELPPVLERLPGSRSCGATSSPTAASRTTRPTRS